MALKVSVRFSVAPRFAVARCHNAMRTVLACFYWRLDGLDTTPRCRRYSLPQIHQLSGCILLQNALSGANLVRPYSVERLYAFEPWYHPSRSYSSGLRGIDEKQPSRLVLWQITLIKDLLKVGKHTCRQTRCELNRFGMKTRTKNGTNRAASPNELVNLQGRETGPLKNNASTQGIQKKIICMYTFSTKWVSEGSVLHQD